jgi:tryptophanyl-tRNA synthetase
MAKTKPTILSGMRPTGTLHLGHYFSVLANWEKAQDDFDCFYMIADLHALTTLEKSENVRSDVASMAALWIAAGIDPQKSVIFRQSDVMEHAELAVILGMLAPLGMLELNPTYKDMKEEHPKFNTLGLLSYPVLQAADILLYKATAVPIGKDQEPHLELARELARRFNARFGKVFVEPKAILDKVTKVASLADPEKKMSKSHSADSYITLLDTPTEIRRKIKHAVTDSGTRVEYKPAEKPALSNLVMLYHLASDLSIKEIEETHAGLGYKEFKENLAEAIIAKLTPLQARHTEIMSDKKQLEKILDAGAEKARAIAAKTLAEAKTAIGL